MVIQHTFTVTSTYIVIQTLYKLFNVICERCKRMRNIMFNTRSKSGICIFLFIKLKSSRMTEYP